MKKNYLLILPLVMILLFVPMAIWISDPSPEAFGGVFFLIHFFPVAFCIMIAAILTITIFFDGGKVLWIATMIAYGISIFLFLPLSLYMSLPFGVLLFLFIKSNKHAKKRVVDSEIS